MLDLRSWLEAWNNYLCCRLSAQPTLVLELTKYQTLMAMLFSYYSTHACLRYDRLFRQAASQNATLRWDTIKEDIYVWCLTRNSPPSPMPGPTDCQLVAPQSVCSPQQPSHEQSTLFSSRPGRLPRYRDRVTHAATGWEICRRYNFGKRTWGEECAFAHVCSTPACHGAHPSKGCPRRPV